MGKLILILSITFVISGCDPSCEDKGMTSEFSHFTLVLIGSQQHNIPNYKCVPKVVK